MPTLNAQSAIRAIVVSLDGDVLDLLDGLPQYDIVGFVDAFAGATDRYYRNLGDDEAGRRIVAGDPALRVILAVDLPAVRAKLAPYYGVDRLITIASPNAVISRTAEVGTGTIVQRGVAIGRNVGVGLACKLNCDAQLHHDVILGDFCTVAPGARLLGNVKVGREAYIGSGAIIMPRISIGSGAIVGAAAVVTRDISDGATAKGVPARTL